MGKVRDFDTYYLCAKEYCKQFGDLLVPQKYVTEYNNEIISLGAWINALRVRYKNNNLDNYQIELLNRIGMVWDVYEKQFMDNYAIAKGYYEEFGNLLIPQEYVVLKEDNGNQVEVKIGNWINNIRCDYENGKLSDERIAKLNEIGMVWNIFDYRFDFYYELAKQYFEFYGNLLVSETYEIDGVKLGDWVHAYRMAYRNKSWRKFDCSHIERLNKIGMVWDIELLQLYDKEITQDSQNRVKKQLLTNLDYFLDHYSGIEFKSSEDCKYLNEQFNDTIPKVKTKS